MFKNWKHRVTLDPEPDPDPNWTKILDPDPSSMYLDPQHCFKKVPPPLWRHSAVPVQGAVKYLNILQKQKHSLLPCACAWPKKHRMLILLWAAVRMLACILVHFNIFYWICSVSGPKKEARRSYSCARFFIMFPFFVTDKLRGAGDQMRKPTAASAAATPNHLLTHSPSGSSLGSSCQDQVE